MFRGSYKAKMDEKERLKMPTAFRKILIEEYAGDDIYITSFDGEKALLYPLTVWNDLEERISRLPKMNAVREKFLRITNYYGMQSKLDAQGRTSLPTILREKSGLNGEVVVMSMSDHFEIWNLDKFDKIIDESKLTDDDRKVLDEMGL